MIDVRAPDRPRVKGDRAHVGAPCDDRQLRRADLVGVAPRGELDARSLEVIRGALRNALLVEGVAAAPLARRQANARMNPLRPALERRGPVVERTHDALADGDVVLSYVELGDRGRALGLREDHPLGAR